MAVLHYLFARFDERFDGAPTLLIPMKRGCSSMTRCLPRIRQWLKTLRKKNVSVIFATQALPTSRIRARARDHRKLRQSHLPAEPAGDRTADSHDLRGLRPQQATDRNRRNRAAQARLLLPIPPRQPPVRPRPGPAAPAFVGASTPQDQRDIDRVLLDAGVPGFAGARLRHRGLDWAADLLPSFPGLAGVPSLTNPRRICHEEASLCRRHRGMLCTATAHAQWVVVDPTNLVQNTLTAIRTLEQINNQIQQLQNEAQMLMNQRATSPACRPA